MRTSRVLVRLPHSHVGLMLLSAVLGAGAAIPVAAYIWLLRYHPDFFSIISYRIWIINSIQAFLALIPYTAFLIWLTRQCQHVRWVVAASMAFATALTAYAMLGIDLLLPWTAWDGVFVYLLLFPITAIIAALVALAVRFLIGTFVTRVVEQDGSLCDHCGYPARRSRSTRCPECGKTISSVLPTWSDRTIAFCHRRKGTVLTFMVLILVAGYALVAKVEFEHRTLGRSFAGDWSDPDHFVYSFSSTDLETITHSRIPSDDNEMLIVVAMANRPAWESRRLEIRLGHLGTFGTEVEFVYAGDPVIFVRVPHEHATDVLLHGPPEQVVERLVNASKEVDWQHTDQPWSVTRKVETRWDEAK